MAINYTVSYTFAPSTTIASSQVNTNFSDNANTWTGIEAGTKSFAKLKVDADPATALEVATKQYADHYNGYRRPLLQYSSASVVNIETGVNGTSGQAQILFSDGSLRTDSTSSRINCDLSRNAVLSGVAQSGLRTGSVSSNTWYAIFAVKVSDSSTNFVTVADTVFPTQANYSTLNTNFGGTGTWCYLGMIRYGDNSGAGSVILSFIQNGCITKFTNGVTGNSRNSQGIRVATTASATSLTYTYASGSGAAQIPSHLSMIYYTGAVSGAAGQGRLLDANSNFVCGADGANGFIGWGLLPAATVILSNSAVSAVAHDIFVNGFVDPVLSSPFSIL